MAASSSYPYSTLFIRMPSNDEFLTADGLR